MPARSFALRRCRRREDHIGALVIEADDEMIKAIKEEYEREKKAEKRKEGEDGG